MKTLLLLLLASPLFAQTEKRVYRADASLLLSCADAVRQNQRPSPYVTLFSEGKKSLAVIAAAHESGPGGPTFKTIDQVLSKVPATQAAVLEGLPFDRDTPEHYQATRVEACAGSGFAGCDEASYAAYKVRPSKAALFSGEPSDGQLLGELGRRGFTPRDMAGFYLLRLFPQWRRENGGTLDRAAAEKKARQFLLSPHNPWKTRFGVDDFMSWYDAHKQGAPADPLKITQDDLRPGDATDFQKINAALCDIREANILRVVEAQINRYDHVLVVYGGLHLAAERAVWQKMLPGKPIDGKFQ